MAKVLVDKEFLENGLNDICDSIRAHGLENGVILGQMSFPSDIQRGVEHLTLATQEKTLRYAAEQAQNFGAKKNYKFWKYYEDITNLKIPYPIQMNNAEQMFSNTYTSDGSTIDLSQFDIDFSQCTNLNYFINISPISKIGVLDTTSCSDLSSLLYNANHLETIEHLILKEDGSQKLSNSFGLSCSKLKHINQITGKFGASFRIYKNNSDPIDHDTVIRILHALKDYSGTTTSPVCTLYSNGWNVVSEEEKKIGTDKGWTLA